MTTVFKDLGLWFWRLAPANPILVRVVHAGGRRVRHLWIRIGYLSILAAVVVIVNDFMGCSSLGRVGAVERVARFRLFVLLDRGDLTG